MRIDDSSIRVNRHTCIACGICVDRCIMDNLRLSVAPCRQACPLGMNCQGYIRLLAMGEIEKAVEQIKPFGPLLDFIASHCDAPCERACVRGKKDDAVHILKLKQYLVKKYSDTLFELKPQKDRTGKHVDVIGGGFTGLSAAFKAVMSGHSVSVYLETMNEDESKTSYNRVISWLEDKGAKLYRQSDLEKDLSPLGETDAIVASSPEHLSVMGITDTIEDKKWIEFCHFKKNIFCCNLAPKRKKTSIHDIAQGFEAIKSVNRFLSGEPLDWGRGFYKNDGAVKKYKVDTRVGSDSKRTPQEEAANGLTDENYQEQASRCFGCGRAFEKNQTCWYCLPCELECPQMALEVRIPYLVR